MNAGEVYKSIKESLSIGYTRFYEIIKKNGCDAADKPPLS